MILFDKLNIKMKKDIHNINMVNPIKLYLKNSKKMNPIIN